MPLSLGFHHQIHCIFCTHKLRQIHSHSLQYESLQNFHTNELFFWAAERNLGIFIASLLWMLCGS